MCHVIRFLLAVVLLKSMMLSPTQAQGHLLPRDRSLPPMQLVNHHIKVLLEDQVAVTRVKQTFRNQSNRPLEAIYSFHVPRGASVKEFSMMVNGKKVKGELVEAAKAKSIYTEIVRRTMDPGLLEYVGSDLLQMSVFPVPARGDQGVEVSFTSFASKRDSIVEFHYPLKAQTQLLRVSGEFSLEMELKSSRPIHNIYSPTHPISFNRKSDRHATVYFDKSMVALDRDLQLFYSTGKDDIGLTVIHHKPDHRDGYALLLLAPRADITPEQRIPRDMVFVLDTSGSMREDGKIEQAKKALKYGLDSLKTGDRFTVIQFATTVSAFSTSLLSGADQIASAKKWIDNLEPTGGTAISDALTEALKLQASDKERQFCIIFLTDGKPTIGETESARILQTVQSQIRSGTRLFTFGVGYDLDASLLDQLAEKNRGSSSFVKPQEDMEIKVSHFFSQINQPVLTDLKLTTSEGVRLLDMYPPQIPDLFHGGQIVVLARTQGTGKSSIKLSGSVGSLSKEFHYELDLQEKPDVKPYVEDLWARRKVGYLLDQIRLRGESKEMVDEVILLAKKYGIATPYTSYLVIPDDVPRPGERRWSAVPPGQSSGLGGMAGGGASLERSRSTREVLKMLESSKSVADSRGATNAVNGVKETLDQANRALRAGDLQQTQQGRLGVDLSVQMNEMKNQSQQSRQIQRQVNQRNCLEVNGVWVDDQYKKETPTFAIKTMSNAYFQLLEKKPEMKDVLQLGASLVWIAPNGTAIVIDPNTGKEEITDEEITRLFTKGS